MRILKIYLFLQRIENSNHLKNYIALIFLMFFVPAHSILECSELFGMCQVCCPVSVDGTHDDCSDEHIQDMVVSGCQKITDKASISILFIFNGQNREPIATFTLDDSIAVQKIYPPDLFHIHCSLII